MVVYDVVIVGGGITGTALFYTLSRYTSMKSIALVEKYPVVASVNSHHTMNSQTLHYGDIETNYSKEKAAKVKLDAQWVASYVEKHGKHLFNKTKKMVLAVGPDEVKELEDRYDDIKDLFPDLKKVGRGELAKIDPKLVEGRDPNEVVMALLSPQGYAINFHNLSTSFVEEAQKEDKTTDLFMGTEVKRIEKIGNNYSIHTNQNTLRAKVIVVCAGGYSLPLAQQLGYGLNYGVFPTAGSFYVAKNALKNKVYRVQIKKLPFAAIHGDPDVVDPSITRFGPTAKVVPLLERYKYGTFWDLLKVVGFKFSGIASTIKILSDLTILKFVSRNFLYDQPFVGKYLFMKHVRKIVPSMKWSDLSHGKNLGGLRPQVVDLKARKLIMGEAKIEGDKAIFNLTPSPGASVCLGNAYRDTKIIMDFFSKTHTFNEKKFLKELGS